MNRKGKFTRKRGGVYRIIGYGCTADSDSGKAIGLRARGLHVAVGGRPTAVQVERGRGIRGREARGPRRAGRGPRCVR